MAVGEKRGEESEGTKNLLPESACYKQYFFLSLLPYIQALSADDAPAATARRRNRKKKRQI